MRYQIVRAPNDSERQRRGELFAKLILDLIGLSGQKQLSKHGKALAFYLLLSRVQQYMPTELLQAAEAALASLEGAFDSAYSRLKQLPKLTSKPTIKYGELHQKFAHGDGAVEWVTDPSSGNLNTIDAATALFHNGTLSDIESLCLMVVDLDNEEIGRAFNIMAYRKWVLGEASGANDTFQQTLQQLVPSFAVVTPGPLKQEARVLIKELEYSSLKDEAESGAVEIVILQGKLRDSALTNVEDRLCSGGLCDFVRASVVCKTEEELIEVYQLLKAAPDDELYVVREKNGFHPDAVSVGGYRDIKLNVLCGKGTAHPHISEVQLILDDFLKLKMQSHMPYAVARGDFSAGKERSATGGFDGAQK